MNVTALYYLHHMFTLVPRHVREDMAWMADVGTDSVAVTVLEQDLRTSRNNLLIICREAERAGMTVHAVPSRWGSLFAGAPQVPSCFASEHPEAWARQKNGQPRYFLGSQLSVHHPQTREFFQRNLETLLKEFPVAGLIWDEPKAISMEQVEGEADFADYSPAARAKMGGMTVPGSWHIDAFADFVDSLGAFARTVQPKLTISMFLYGWLTGYPVERMGKIASLDYFGCDGKPWALADLLESPGYQSELIKALLDQGPMFLKIARTNGKGGLFLIENHNMPDLGAAIMDRRLPDVLALCPESLLYYYYPINLSDPDRDMNVVAKHLRTLKKP